MRKSVITVLCLCLLFITGCDEEIEEPVVESVDLRPITTSIVWDNKVIQNISPVSAFESSTDMLQIFPYNNNDKHITIRKIIVSDNGFWNTVMLGYEGTENIIVTEQYSLVTNNKECTFGYIPIDYEWAYIVYSETLPSSYVEYVMKVLCNSST